MTQEQWNNFHAERKFCPVYPNERVVSWVFRNFPKAEANSYKMLDLGAGAGRHSIFMAQEGYSVSACDFSANGIKETKIRADHAELSINTAICEADNLDIYPTDSFDGVLCFGVLYYMPFNRYCKAVQEIHRVLKPGGKALVLTRTDKDSRCEKANKVNHCTYIVPQLDNQAPSKVESGMVMIFLGKQDIIELFEPFSKLTIDRILSISENGAFADDDWLVMAAK